MSIASRFEREGYRVGLISRSQEKLNGYVKELASLKIESVAHAANVRDKPRALSAIENIHAKFGSINVLEYSPLIDMSILVSVLKRDVELVQKELEFSILGVVAVVNAVVDDMIKKGNGALLFTLGAKAYMPGPSYASGALGCVAFKQYALNLAMALEPKGIYVETLAIDQPLNHDEIAEIYWKRF
jgi:NADP-dependent 3-hydroxy acid dehydrogenase YdfG